MYINNWVVLSGDFFLFVCVYIHSCVIGQVLIFCWGLQKKMRLTSIGISYWNWPLFKPLWKKIILIWLFFNYYSNSFVSTVTIDNRNIRKKKQLKQKIVKINVHHIYWRRNQNKPGNNCGGKSTWTFCGENQIS